MWTRLKKDNDQRWTIDEKLDEEEEEEALNWKGKDRENEISSVAQQKPVHFLLSWK